MDRTKYVHQDVTNESALLWESIAGSRVDRFHAKIVPHEKSVLFGYADVTLTVKTATGVIFPIKLRGLVVKSLKGRPHVDMPADKGSDGEYYDIFMPRSAALRAVLTALIFDDPEVAATIEQAATAPPAGESTGTSTSPAAGTEETQFSSGNPFAGEGA